MRAKRITALFLCVALLVSTLTSCGFFNTGHTQDEKPKPQVRSYFNYFDTVSSIYSYKQDGEEVFLSNCAAVTELLDEYHKLFDIYYTYAGMNNLRTVNKNAGIAPVEVDGRLIDFLLYAKEMYTLTGGRVNIAMGAVLKLWHDCREDAEDDPEAARLPDEAALREAALHTDIDCLIIDREAGTVYLSDPKMSLDVGAIGKGYAAEMAAKALEERGVSSYVLNIGGNLRLIGTHTDGDGWTIGVTNPDRTAEDFAARITVSDTSVVTSGNYERYYTVDGVDYHHIIDPDTLYPAEYFASVTIITKHGGLADALSTALFCMSYDDGMSLLASLEDEVEVIWITSDGTQYRTDGVPVAG